MARSIGVLKGKLVCDDYSDEDVDHGSGDESSEDFELSLEKLNLGPKKKLLVLGFGGFLCYRVNICDHQNKPTFRRHDASYGNNLIYRRSHLEGFMKFCLERFHVAIWSSANEYNLNKTLECIMEKFKNQLLFAWGQDKCTETGFGSLEKKDKPLFLKELKKVWDNNNASLPNCEEKFDRSNTLLIDDKPYKALLNPVHNGIFPHQYRVSDSEEALGPESELRRYLEKLVKVDDVPSFVKENPFGQMGITSKHPQWNYYSKVVSKYQKNTTAWVVANKFNDQDDK